MKPTPVAATSVAAIAIQMFQCSSVPRMPIMRPAEPVMTPADRSNSPPIISRATSTAGMPIVDATSVQFEIPSSFRNSALWVQKKIAMTIAASAAPISGRRRRRVIGEIWASRSSPGRVGGGGAVPAVCGVTAPDAIRFTFIKSLSLSLRRVGGRPARAAHQPHHLAGALPRELLDGCRVGLVDESRSGQDRLATAHRVRVLLEELQEHDWQVTLQVLLLIDSEHDAAALDVLDHGRADVEGRYLRVRARALDRGDGRRGDVGVQRDDAVDRLVGLQLRLDLGLRRRDVGRALDVRVLDGAAEALLYTLAALLEADVVLLVDHAEHLLDACVLKLRAGGLAGDLLSLADVRNRTDLLELVDTGVQRDDRDAGVLGLLQRTLDRVVVRHRDRQAIDLLGDRRRDQLRLLLRVVVRRAPDELDALGLRRRLCPLLHDR